MVLRVRLTNRYAYFLDHYPKELDDKFSFFVPGYWFVPAYKRFKPDGTRLWDGKRHLIKYRKIQAGCFLAMRKQILSELPIEFVIDDCRKRPEFHRGTTSDRDFQNECVEKMIKRSNCGGLIINATGTGKTRIAGQYFSRLVGGGLFIVDELTLADQAVKELTAALGERVGWIGNMEFKPRRVTVATIQTLHRHVRDIDYKDWIKTIQAVFIDEIHLALNKRNLDTLAKVPAKAMFGLTATLELNKRDVWLRATALAGPVIYEYPYEEGVKDKYLSPAVVAGVTITAKGPGIKLEPWDMYDEMIAENRRWLKTTVRLVRVGIRKGKHIIVLVDRVKHLKKLSHMLRDIPHRVAWGGKKTKDRIKAKTEFDSDKIRLIIANRVFKKGISINSVDVIIDCACRVSKNDARQKLGRGVRLCKGKRGLIYVDQGYANPPDTVGELYFNKFEKATKSRRAAFRKQGVEVVIMPWRGNPKHIYREAEVALSKVLKKAAKRR